MPVVTIRLELLEGLGRAMGHGQQRLVLHFEGFGTLWDLQGLTVNCKLCCVQLESAVATMLWCRRGSTACTL